LMRVTKWILVTIITLIFIDCHYSYADDNNIISFKKTVEEHRTHSSAVGISVNSKEEIALGFWCELYENNYINVYDSSGKFINGYTFNTYGSYEFKYDEEDNIMIFCERSDICYFFNTDAELIKTIEFSSSIVEDRYLRSVFSDNKELSINGNHYKLSNYSFGHTILTKTDENGNITIIYDIGKDYAAVRSNLFFGLLLIILIIVHIKNHIAYRRAEEK